MLIAMQLEYVKAKSKGQMARKKLLVVIKERRYEPQEMASREVGRCKNREALWKKVG
jgi:hypothetical protein